MLGCANGSIFAQSSKVPMYGLVLMQKLKRSPNNSVMTNLKAQMVDLTAGRRGVIYVTRNFTAKPVKQMKSRCHVDQR